MRNRRSLNCLCLSLLLAAFVLSLGLGGYFWQQNRTVPENGQKAEVSLAEQAKKKVAVMSPEQRVGQLMMIGIMGTSIDQDAAYQISQYHAGNIILFDRNMQSRQQVLSLNENLRRQIQRQTNDIPPFIAIDQEGGFVLRMREAFPRIPSEQQLGEDGDPGAAETWAAETGKELKKMGFNLNFAPVVDLGLPSERSYSTDPDVVVQFARQAVQGYEEARIFCALKHFPGIGKVQTDPHIDGDQVTASKEALLNADMKPFSELIQLNDPETMFIMVSNVTFPALDASLPACVSPAVMTGILRQHFDYKGLILSDDMEMGAMSKHYSFSDMGVMAVRAGADIVLVCHDYGHEQEVYAGLLKAYNNDVSFRQLVDEKVERIVLTKLRGQQNGYFEE